MKSLGDILVEIQFNTPSLAEEGLLADHSHKHRERDFIYQSFTFDTAIKERFYAGDKLLSWRPDLSMDESLELALDMVGDAHAFLPGIVQQIEHIIGKENCIYDFWEFGPDCFSLFWWIKREVYHEKMQKIKQWLEYEEIEHLVEFEVKDR